MKSLAAIIAKIENTSSRNAKESLLEQHRDTPGFKELLHFIYNPYERTCISDKKMRAYKTSRAGTCSMEDAIKYFSEHKTGTQSDVEFAWFFINSQETPEARDLAYSMVTKNLKIGVTERTLNKIYGASFIPVIGCELGKEYGDAKSRMSGIYISSRKIDGVRRVLVKEDGKVMMYSRSGIADDGLVDIIDEAKYLPDNMVYDGELEAIGTFANNLALRQATNSIANRGGQRTGLMFNIFDAVPVDEFKAGESKHIALVRKRFIDILFGYSKMDDVPPLEHLDKMKVITAVPIECVSDDIALHEKVFHRFVDNGEEGLMLIKASSLYKVGKRTYDWVKMKNYMKITLPVVDIFEGGGKFCNMLGGVNVLYKGQAVGVGSGFNDFERNVYWSEPNSIVGKMIMVHCQGESVDSATGNVSLNCPIYKGLCKPGDKLYAELTKMSEDEA